MPYTDSGRIIKMTGGLYTVRLDPPSTDKAAPTSGPLAGHTVECRARGQFRHARVSPLVGDRVTVYVPDYASVYEVNGSMVVCEFYGFEVIKGKGE